MSVLTDLQYIVFIVSALAQGYHCIAANSTTPGAWTALPGQALPQRRSADLVESLRRQLMRDNYDYQTANTDDERNKYRQQGKQKGSNQFNSGGKLHEQMGNHVVTGESRERRVPPQWRDGGEHNRAHAPHAHQKPEHNMRQALNPGYPSEERDAEDNNYAKEMHDALGPNFSPYKRSVDDSSVQDKPEAYEPTYSKQRRDTLNPRYSLDRRDSNVAGKRIMQVAPVHNERVPRVKEHARDSQDTGDAIDKADVQTAADLQNASDKQYPYGSQQADDKQADSTDSKASQETDGRPVIEDTPEPNKHSSRVKHYEPVKDDLDKSDEPDAGHAIAKKDLLYYMDDDRMRRNNDVSADLSSHSTDIEHATRHANTSAQHAMDASGVSDSYGENSAISNPRPERTTVSTDQVTYKILKVASRGGRRSAARRVVAELAPHGVALLSLDAAPPPPLRLARARRQYMHERRDRRPPLAGAALRRHHHSKH